MSRFPSAAHPAGEPVRPWGARVGGERQRAEQQYGTMWLCSILVEADRATPDRTA